MASEIGLRGHRVQNPERADARRRDILVAAARTFARLGYAGASLTDVAAQLGVSKGVIYYYFRGKEEIYAEIIMTAIAEAIERLESIVTRGDPPDVTLRAAITDLVSHLFDALDRYATILRASGSLSADTRGLIRTYQRRYERLIRDIVSDGIAAGVFVERDPTLMTFTMLRACLGVPHWYSPTGRLPPPVITQQVTDQVLSGVLRHDHQSPMQQGI